MNRIKPGPGQESVWDYPRPPLLEPVQKQVKVVFNGVTIAETSKAYRVLETSHPPTYYIPPQDVDTRYLIPVEGRTLCEWKGQAAYFDVLVEGHRAARAAWIYPSPNDSFKAIAGHFCFYPSKMDACYIDGEQVQAQAGDFYGGWITNNIVGPFKGSSGTMFW